ncbi:Rossmann-like and DUF2520 domain-containing protein [uncultured Maribacter sp.]|uniref:Rossmann-like and DUF2520 domain-containing protein n=1 Tax=uncultured Maribacter sp. TaxID=431308 RepID=UPI002603B620|nr:Rossmann-like and DUF2520 domain-containing protein [uncultured Maribacter sp.]
MLEVVILGTGNIAQHLFDTLTTYNDITVVQVVGRNPKALAYFGEKSDIQTSFKKIKTADLYIIAVSDNALGDVSHYLHGKKGVIAHTTGSISMNILQEHKNHGVFYPLQTFTKNQKVNFKTVPLCIEANNNESYSLLKKLAEVLSDNVYDITSEQRKKLHLAAVFINNFSNYVYQIGNDICEENNLSFDILKPLILETAKKATLFNPETVQTGPGRRNDLETIDIHKEQIKNIEHLKIYNVMTDAILSKYGKKL